MRKISAILLFTLMLFNLVGYKALFSYLDNKAVADMVKQLDVLAYNRASLVEIKIPLHLPYTNDNKDFERYDGTIELDGVSYSYVERKVMNDTLVLHCLPNTAKDVYSHVEKEYAKSVNGLLPQQSGHKSADASLLLKSLLFLYNRQADAQQFVSCSTHICSYSTHIENIPSQRFKLTPEQPPEAV